MIYEVSHITEYFYGDPVPLCHDLVHLKPRETTRQKLLSHSLQISPSPLVRAERIDFFGNFATWFSVQEPHERMRIVAKSLVDVKPFEAPAKFIGPAWDEAVKMLVQRRERDCLDARQFAFDSPHVATGPELADYARSSFPPARPLLEAVLEFTQRIHNDFEFDSQATTIGTPVVDVLKHRHGVCQDFAHLQISCLRALGLAARYVSGYLRTVPPPGQERMAGADASHAWVSVFFPDFGWIDFDPTNGIIPTNGHITLAWARDYTDLSPVKGVVVGSKRHSLSVSVDVEAITEKAEGKASA